MTPEEIAAKAAADKAASDKAIADKAIADAAAAATAAAAAAKPALARCLGRPHQGAERGAQGRVRPVPQAHEGVQAVFDGVLMDPAVSVEDRARAAAHAARQGHGAGEPRRARADGRDGGGQVPRRCGGRDPRARRRHIATKEMRAKIGENPFRGHKLLDLAKRIARARRQSRPSPHVATRGRSRPRSRPARATSRCCSRTCCTSRCRPRTARRRTRGRASARPARCPTSARRTATGSARSATWTRSTRTASSSTRRSRTARRPASRPARRAT
jgi:hypothetical protein